MMIQITIVVDNQASSEQSSTIEICPEAAAVMAMQLLYAQQRGGLRFGTPGVDEVEKHCHWFANRLADAAGGWDKIIDIASRFGVE